MENDVILLLLGANQGAYALASVFAGEYGVPVCVMDEEIPQAFLASAFVRETRGVSGIGYRGFFLRALSDFYEANAEKSILLLPMTEEYVARTLAEKETLARMFLLPQKKCLHFEIPNFLPTALLLYYVGRTGSVRTAYAEVAAGAEDGTPLALITKTTPKELAISLPHDTPHFVLYALGKGGECVPVGEEYAPYLAFPAAADLSLAEWLLVDYVTCEGVESDGEAPSGLFTLFSYKKIKRYFSEAYLKEAKALRKKRLSVTLYPARGETRALAPRLCLRRFYRDIWEKTTKPKK